MAEVVRPIQYIYTVFDLDGRKTYRFPDFMGIVFKMIFHNAKIEINDKQELVISNNEIPLTIELGGKKFIKFDSFHFDDGYKIEDYCSCHLNGYKIEISSLPGLNGYSEHKEFIFFVNDTSPRVLDLPIFRSHFNLEIDYSPNNNEYILMREFSYNEKDLSRFELDYLQYNEKYKQLKREANIIKLAAEKIKSGTIFHDVFGVIYDHTLKLSRDEEKSYKKKVEYENLTIQDIITKYLR